MRNRLRELRLRRNLTQQRLADLSGVTRQTVGGIESGLYGPSVDIALRLCDALGCRVEDLFTLDAAPRAAALVGVESADAGPWRVALAEISGRKVARPLVGLGSFRWSTAAAHGLARTDGEAGAGNVAVREFAQHGHGLFLAGCDPALGLLCAHITRGAGRVEALWWNAGNAEAKSQLGRGEAHAISVHGAVGAADASAPFPVRRFRIASWQMGWIVVSGNPKAILDPLDLMRPDVRLVNREQGSGARAVLDGLLAEAGIAPARVTGYARVVRGHFDVADAVALGAADVGVGIEAAALARGLSFVPLRSEASDLVVAEDSLEDPTLASLMEALCSAPFRTDLSAFGPYDTSQTGDRIA